MTLSYSDLYETLSEFSGTWVEICQFGFFSKTLKSVKLISLLVALMAFPSTYLFQIRTQCSEWWLEICLERDFSQPFEYRQKLLSNTRLWLSRAWVSPRFGENIWNMFVSNFFSNISIIVEFRIGFVIDEHVTAEFCFLAHSWNQCISIFYFTGEQDFWWASMWQRYCDFFSVFLQRVRLYFLLYWRTNPKIIFIFFVKWRYDVRKELTETYDFS